MYTFSSKLKTFSLILMAVGLLGIGYGFYTAPKDIKEVEALLAAESHGGHSAVTHEATEATEAKAEAPIEIGHEANEAHNANQSHEMKAEAPIEKAHEATEAHEGDAHAEHEAHLTHVLHQLQNKPWAALYVACIFFLLISMGTLAFYAIQQVAQAGWSPVLFRVMQGITAYLPVGSVLFFVFLILSGLHFNHLFVWLGEGVTDTTSANYDHIIAGKAGYLNFPFWIVRAAIFLLGWNAYRYYSRKNCLAQDEADDNLNYKKNLLT